MSKLKFLMIFILSSFLILPLFNNCSGGTHVGDPSSQEQRCEGDGCPLTTKVVFKNVPANLTVKYCLGEYNSRVVSFEDPSQWLPLIENNMYFDFGLNMYAIMENYAGYAARLFASVREDVGLVQEYFITIDEANVSLGDFNIPHGVHEDSYFRCALRCVDEDVSTEFWSLLIKNEHGTFYTYKSVYLGFPGQVTVMQNQVLEFDFGPISQELLNVQSNEELEGVLQDGGLFSRP